MPVFGARVSPGYFVLGFGFEGEVGGAQAIETVRLERSVHSHPLAYSKLSKAGGPWVTVYTHSCVGFPGSAACSVLGMFHGMDDRCL